MRADTLGATASISENFQCNIAVAGAILTATVSFYDVASRGVAHKLSRLIVLATLCIFWLLFNRIVTIYLDKLA